MKWNIFDDFFRRTIVIVEIPNITCFDAESFAFAMQIYAKSCRNPRWRDIKTDLILIGMVQLGFMCHGSSIDNGGSLDIIRFPHCARSVRTALAVEQLIICRFNAPNFNESTEQ